MNNYDNTSISALKGADRVRKRPSVIFGSDNIEGCKHSFFEILSNSIDEAREGFGKVIEVSKTLDNIITVKDYGRGIPLDYNENENRYNWELVFCELYAGGKYKNNTDGNYEFSLGLNGLGSCATQYSSEFMKVISFRDGFKYSIDFEKGENISNLQKQKMNYEHTGTIISWRPDFEVFTQIDIPFEYFEETLKKQAIINAGLKFKLKVETDAGVFTEREFLYENGIKDYIKELSNFEEISSIQYFTDVRKGKDREDMPEYKLKMEVSFCFNNSVNIIEYYHNSSFLEYGGSPDKALKSAFISVIDKFLKPKYTKDESKISFVDIQDSLIFISNSFSTLTSYENQTKKAINNKFIQEAMTEFLKHQLEVFFIENKAEGEKILQQILINKRSRENAEKMRINIKKKLTGNIDISNRVQKYADCRIKDVAKRELYIVEGDSALGSCKLARDANFQAIMPVRGKILNCLKADYDKIFKNDIIVDLLKVLGCGIEIKSKHKDLHSFSLENLRFGKVIICTDADVDGFQIRTLILTMLFTLTPTLIEEGKVYIAESPLYEITSKNKTYFAYSDKEKNSIVSRLKNYTLQRSKGLGENEPDMMWQTTMNPETRRLIKILPDDILETEKMFDILLGNNLSGRKDFISSKGSNYLEMVDVS